MQGTDITVYTTKGKHFRTNTLDLGYSWEEWPDLTTQEQHNAIKATHRCKVDYFVKTEEIGKGTLSLIRRMLGGG